MQRIDWKEHRTNIALFLFTTVVLLVIIEIYLRAFPLIHMYDFMSNTYELDEEIGYKHRPNLDYTVHNPEFSYRLKTNSYGFRDIEYSQGDVENSFVILSLGDSFAFGYGVEENESFPSIIENRLNADGIKSVVINTAVPGYGAIQESRTAKRYAPIFKPGMMILNVFVGNDIDDDYEFTQNSRWVLREGRVERSGAAERVATEEEKMSLIQKINAASNKLYIVKHIKYFLAKNPLVYQAFNKIIGSRNLDIRYEQFAGNYSQKTDEAWSIMLRQLGELKKYADSINSSLVIVLFPSKPQIDMKVREEVALINNMELEDMDFRKPNKILKRFADSNGIYIIETADKLASDAAKYHFKIDGHLNKEGNGFVAQILYNDIKSLVENASK